MPKYKRGTDGYFQTMVWDGDYTDTGKKHYKRVRSKKSSRDLEQKVAEIVRLREERKTVKSTDMTFYEYAKVWREVYKSNRSANTQAMYDNVIDKHLSDLTVPLREVGRIHIQQAINAAAGHARTQQQIYMTCKQIIKSAVADQLLPPGIIQIFDSLDKPVYSAGERRPLYPHEKAAVFKADLSDQDRAFLYLLYGCGIRRGEALALTVFDFNLAEHTVTISKAHEFSQRVPTQKDPKSVHGFRTIPVPDFIFGAVKRHIETVKGSGSAYLFTMRDGKPMTLSSYTKMWRRIVKAMQEVSDQKIEGLTAHIFRHNYCTNLCYQIPKISIKHIAYLLGDTEKMVLDVYNHIILDKEDAAGAVAAALR